jgi:outer membrane protein
MKKIIIFSTAAFIFLFPSFVLRAQDLSLSLEDAVSLALRDNRDIRLKAEDLKKAKAKINEARSSLYPSFSAGAGWSDIRGLYSKDVSGFSGQTGVSQLIYTGGQVINAIKAGEANYIATQAELDKVKLETVLSVKKAYYAILLADRFSAINKAIVENALEHLAYVQERFSQGQASESELIRMRSSLAGVSQAYEASLSQVDSAQAFLNNLLFLDKETRIKPEGQFSYEPKEIAYDKAFLKALQSRPEIRQLDAQKNVASRNVEIARSGNRPQVSAAWDYYSSQHLAIGTAKNQNDYNVLGIVVNWPIFDGQLTKSKVEQAIVDLKEAQLLKEKTVKDIALELKTAYLELKDAIEKIKTLGEEANVYQDNLSVIQEKQKAGLASGLDLADARLSYSVALFNQIQANYDYTIAKIKFDKATGGQL